MFSVLVINKIKYILSVKVPFTWDIKMFQTCNMLPLVAKAQSFGLLTFSSLAWNTEQGTSLHS